jgi:hypothetical protein
LILLSGQWRRFLSTSCQAVRCRGVGLHPAIAAGLTFAVHKRICLELAIVGWSMDFEFVWVCLDLGVFVVSWCMC